MDRERSQFEGFYPKCTLEVYNLTKHTLPQILIITGLETSIHSQ